MKITTSIMNIIARSVAFAAVFTLALAPIAPAFAQSYDYDYDYGDYYDYDYGSYDYDYDYDYGDYYSYDYGYDSTYDYSYDYGDYYSYNYPTDTYTYDYGYDYGDYYTYDYGVEPTYDYSYDYGDYYTYVAPTDTYNYNYTYDYGDYYSYNYPTDTYTYDYGYDYGDYYTYVPPTDGTPTVPPIYVPTVPPIYVPPIEDPYYPPTYPPYEPPIYVPPYEPPYVPPTYPPYEPPIYVPPTTTTYDRPTCTLDASDNSIDAGDSFRLRWTTTDATAVSITTLGAVDLDGSASLSPRYSMGYTLYATGPGGFVSCTEYVEVENDYEPPVPPSDNDDVRCDAFTASDTLVEKNDSVTLRWSTTGADSVRIDQGVGSVSDDGSERVRITRDTTFTLTARDGSDTDTCRVTVRIEDEDDNDDDDNDRDVPRCRLTISDTQITSGQAVTLSWDNLRTDRAILRDSFGNLIADSRTNAINEDKDSRVFRPTRSTDYTLTVYNGNTTRTCTVGTQVVGGVSLTGTRGQDGILLSNVPYTGFEAGPVLTFIFYSALGLWGIAVAYALVAKKAAVAAVATAAAHTPAVVAPIAATTTFAPEAVENLPFIDDASAIVDTEDALRTLEARAHAQQALISSDALNHLVNEYGVQADDVLDRVIAQAKASFPTEAGWTVLNKERVLSLLA